jgi:CHAT domain-containing protein/tetratricopeptide (TPR) repeat protein
VTAYTESGNRRDRANAFEWLSRAAPARDEKAALLERALEDARAAADTRMMAAVEHSLGDLYFNSGQYERSLESLRRAAGLYQDSGQLVPLGTVYNSIGRLYRVHGHTQLALDSQLKALEIHERAQSPFELMQSLNAVASVRLIMLQYDQARSYQERAVAVAGRIATPRILDFVNGNLANILLLQGEYARAATILEGIVARGIDAFPHVRQGMLSAAYVKLGRLAEGLAAAEKSVAGCPDMTPADCITAYYRRAEAHFAMGDPAATLADMRLAIDRVEAQRSRLIPSDFLKDRYSALQQAAFSFAISLQLREQLTTEALEMAELARARAFLDLLASREAPAAPAPVLPNPPGAPASSDVSALFKALPSSASARAATASDLVALASRLSSTLLVYWVANDEVFIWAVSPGGRVQATRVAVPSAKLSALVAATAPIDAARPAEPASPRVTTRGSMSIAVAAPRSPAWRELYDLLIRPVRASLPTGAGALLTIVPHGALTGLSFAALHDARGRYLIEDYTLHYAPAGNVMQTTRGQRRANARTGPMLVVADATPPRVSSLGPPLGRLPGARAEARSIASLVPAARLTQLIGNDATEARIRDAAAGKAVIHVATHAIARDSDPFASFLAVGPGADRSDGLLTAREIYDLRLDADLVVLSACQSGGAVTGDGIATFARAFIHAGTPALIVSQWDVPDEPTSNLLAGFYRSWLAGQSKARALRAAQLDVLRGLRQGRIRIDTAIGPVALPEHPVFWAGFALIGEPE